MKKLIELHDSVITSVINENNNLVITLDPLVVLTCRDPFGFEFEDELTESLKGTIRIYESSRFDIRPGVLFDGYIQIDECKYELIPVLLNIKGNCVLNISNNNGEQLIFGSRIEVLTDNLEK